jgi:hypothetical protein
MGEKARLRPLFAQKTRKYAKFRLNGTDFGTQSVENRII